MKTRARRTAAGLVGVGVVLLTPLPLAAQELRYSGSLGYSVGQYIFTEPTASYSLLSTLSLRLGRLDLSAGFPVVLQNSTAVSLLGGVFVPTGGPQGGAVGGRQPGEQVPMGPGGGGGGGGGPRFALAALGAAADSGLTVAEPGTYRLSAGDPVVSATVQAFRGTGTLRSLDLSAHAKAPLVDPASGVGTGQWDYGAGAGLTLAAGRLLLFADAAWWRLGDLPDLELRDYLDASVGVGFPLAARWNLLASAATASRVIDTVEPARSLGASLGYLTPAGHGLSLGVGLGLSESTPDLSVFAGWSVGRW